jgi:quercetin dioxygenase-like cupin family protein
MDVIHRDQLPRIGSSWDFVGADHGGVPVSFYLVEAQPGKGAPLHCHDYDEVVLVEEGRSRFVVGGAVRECSAGEILVVKAGTPHGFVNVGADVLRQVDIHASARFAQRNLPPTETSRAAGLPE